MITAEQIKIVVFCLLLILCLFLGWYCHSVYDGYKQNQQAIAVQTVQKTIQEGQATIAKGFEEQKQVLSDLAKQNTSTVQTIIKQPIYQNECIDQSGLEQLQKYKEDSK